MEFVLLESFENYIDASLTLGRMEEAGINCWLKDENTATINPILTSAIGGIKLMVDKEDMERAVEILNALKEIRRKSFTCPNCGSHNIEYINSPRKAINWISSFVTWLLGNYAIGIEQIWHCFDCGKDFKEPISNNENFFNEDEEKFL
jgi:predicted RNA-binding Zn-ribbon protein involved in translation (DUF1610 family)